MASLWEHGMNHAQEYRNLYLRGPDEDTSSQAI